MYVQIILLIAGFTELRTGQLLSICCGLLHARSPGQKQILFRVKLLSGTDILRASACLDTIKRLRQFMHMRCHHILFNEMNFSVTLTRRCERSVSECSCCPLRNFATSNCCNSVASLNVGHTENQADTKHI